LIDKSTLKIISNCFEKLYSDPKFIDSIIEADRKRFEWKMKSYDQKLNYYKDNPDFEVISSGNGFRAFKKDSKEGKEIRAARIKRERDQENKKFESENPMESALILLMGKDSVSRSEARAALDSKNIKFSIEKLNEFIEMLEDEGIEIK